MLKVDGELHDGHMRCAKRSSAALRTALQKEQDSRCVSCTDNKVCTAIVPFDTNSTVSRLRRDIKAVYDQVGSAVFCGDQPWTCVWWEEDLRIPPPCCYCGAICTVAQHNTWIRDMPHAMRFQDALSRQELPQTSDIDTVVFRPLLWP